MGSKRNVGAKTDIWRLYRCKKSLKMLKNSAKRGSATQVCRGSFQIHKKSAESYISSAKSRQVVHPHYHKYQHRKSLADLGPAKLGRATLK